MRNHFRVASGGPWDRSHPSPFTARHPIISGQEAQEEMQEEVRPVREMQAREVQEDLVGHGSMRVENAFPPVLRAPNSSYCATHSPAGAAWPMASLWVAVVRSLALAARNDVVRARASQSNKAASVPLMPSARADAACSGNAPSDAGGPALRWRMAQPSSEANPKRKSWIAANVCSDPGPRNTSYRDP